MKALAVVAPRTMELVDISAPNPGPAEVLIRIQAVGICGTDFHIFEGKANYNFDRSGIEIPLARQPQVLGHEIAGVVVETGSAVTDLKAGDRVVVDQGINCSSRGKLRADWCEYCLTSSSHQCLDYQELGITGQQGALAEFLSIPAVNAIRFESGLQSNEAAMAEPLGCIIHACSTQLNTPARYTFGGRNPIRSVLICGAGPAGLLFTQYLRRVVGYTGLLIVSEPNATRRALAESFGATVLDPNASNLREAVSELTAGERINYLIESAGIGGIFPQTPGILRKQGTILLYGHGHHGIDLGSLNPIQFMEPTLIAPCGASGAIDSSGRPETTARSLDLLTSGVIDVSRLISHEYTSLGAVREAFTADRLKADYIKGVATL